MPWRIIASPDGTVQRVHLRLKVTSFLFPDTTRLAGDLPFELLSVLPEAELRRYLDELRTIGRLRSPILRYCLTCRFWGPMQADVRRWSAALDEWQRRMNRDFLEPRQMQVMTQSRCVVIRGRGARRDTEHWLAFAMTQWEADRLLEEPYLLGDVADWKEGLTIHPF